MAAKDKGTPRDLGLGDWMKTASTFWQGQFNEARSPDNAEAMDRLKAMQADMMAFIDARVAKDIEAVRRMSTAKSPADIGKVQLEYLQDLMVDYNKQAMKAAEEAGKAMVAAVQKLPKGM